MPDDEGTSQIELVGPFQAFPGLADTGIWARIEPIDEEPFWIEWFTLCKRGRTSELSRGSNPIL
jgi:hypothetical protein